MTDQAMSPLRRRMIEDMTIGNLSPRTQQGYIRTVQRFAAFLGRSPDTTPTSRGARAFCPGA
jgi:integrase/recombinase XerD